MVFTTLNTFAYTEIRLDESITHSKKMKFIPHIGHPNSFNNALALNIEYDQVEELRKKVTDETGKTLNYLTSWDKKGEAHVTTISPLEYRDVLKHYISMKRINEIAHEQDIQSSDLKILGLGSGKKSIAGVLQETFFIIVDSSKLRKIRHIIYGEYINNGGNPRDFDPAWFFPHITIGYTKKDIHESSGLYKNIKYSYDQRFKIIIN